MENRERRKIGAVANESLTIFSKVAEYAQELLRNTSRIGGAGSFTNINTLVSAKPIAKLQEVSQENIKSYQILSREPAIARVMTIDENEKKKTYYICRPAPVAIDDPRIDLASYRSPIGRLASLPVGEEHSLALPLGDTSVEILERAELHPILTRDEWDSDDTVLEGDTYGPITVNSLRAFLKQSDNEVDTTLLDDLLEDDKISTSVTHGLSRNLITKMSLRDRPILDQFQDDIFRLPLNSRLLILGAPGTGKTTTLIKRLGQKLDMEFLDQDERQVIESHTFTRNEDHNQSWILFTPTELLRLYVKEAFNKEGIPASDDRIQTWADYRKDLARNHFGILRSATGRGLIMKDTTQTLEAGDETDQTAWFSDFDHWQKANFWEGIRVSAQSLTKNSAQGISKLGGKVLSILERAGPKPQPGALVPLAEVTSEIRDLVEGMNKATNEKIRNALNLQVNQDKNFLDDMARFIGDLPNQDDEMDDQDSEDEEETDEPRVGRRAAAVQYYMRAIRSHARAQARRRVIDTTSRTARLIEWIGTRLVSGPELLDVGNSLIVQSALRRIASPVDRYVNHVPARYRSFRRVRQKEKRWYFSDGFRPEDVHPLEVDVILLGMIRNMDDLVASARRSGGAIDPHNGALGKLRQLYRTQVLVDEATDFSPIQLACMARLAKPEVRSFFACGDFNQRITNYGTRSIQQMKWAVPDIDIRKISIAYRQSRQLHDLTQEIVHISGGDPAPSKLPKSLSSDGISPVLVENVTCPSKIAIWLADRIMEIENLVRKLPSIAVFVSEEEDVYPTATHLDIYLKERNIDVIPCVNGQVQGIDSAVRVFSVQHIKGLEFEAAFFVSIDKLVRLHPDLFDKYLYVGATRSATYLGVTCEHSLPQSVTRLRKFFEETWE